VAGPTHDDHLSKSELFSEDPSVFKRLCSDEIFALDIGNLARRILESWLIPLLPQTLGFGRKYSQFSPRYLGKGTPLCLSRVITRTSLCYLEERHRAQDICTKWTCISASKVKVL
jgi:hypothetical protein